MGQSGHAVIIVASLVRHSGCQSQAVKNPGEQRHTIYLFSPCTCCHFPISSCHCLSLCICFLCTLTVVYFWRVISSFRVSTTGFQAHPVKHMPDQRASHRPWVFQQLLAPVATRDKDRLSVWLSNSKSMWLFKGEMHDSLTWLHVQQYKGLSL